MKTRLFLFFAVLWLGLNGISLLLQIDNANKAAENIAFAQGQLFFNHIVTMRRWNAEHGGVYVPVTEKTRPNPYLKTPDRNIVTQDGKVLTLINPALMTRQLAEMEHAHSNIQFHITSLHPIRPANKADDWETEALLKFENGVERVMESATLNDAPFYRYMEPLKIVQPCLQCHDNYQLGDIRGGISVSIPKANITPYVEGQLSRVYWLHGGIASMGLLLLIVFHLSERTTNARLKQVRSKLHLAYIDALTGLPNRRYYDEYVRREWRHALRHRYPVSIIMIDIDFFKRYNDAEGHLAGDRCLIEVARVLKSFFKRSDDLICRYGGEEFCAVASCNAGQGVVLAEKLRVAVEARKLKHPDSPIARYVTLSLGVATMTPDQSLAPEQVLHSADQALYRAKQAGRNRVEHANSDAQPDSS